MITLIDKSKVSFFDYFYLFCVIIFAGQASGFVREFGDIRTLGNTFMLGLTFLFALYKKVKMDSRFMSVIGVFLLYSVLVILKTGSSQYFLYEFSQWLMIFFVAFVVCKGYSYRFFIVSETIFFHLAIIALIGWVILLTFPHLFTELLSYISLKGFSNEESEFGEYYAEYNIFIYTINGVNHIGESNGIYFFKRNAGFAWEPGAFACFMCFAIYFNIMRTGLRFRHNKEFVIFIIALISTQSLTGYVTFTVMMIFWVSARRKPYWLFLLIPIIMLGMKLPFISEKIALNTEDISYMSIDDVSQGEKYDRLFSFMLLWEEFLSHPLLGYGFSESLLMRYEVTVWSGIGKLLAQYGIIMTLIFTTLLLNTAKKLNQMTQHKYGYVLLPAMLGMMVSYHIWSQPFFAAIWLSCIFIREQRSKFLRI